MAGAGREEGGWEGPGREAGPHDPASPRSALESLQCVRAAQAPHWVSLQQQGQPDLGWQVGWCLRLPSVTVTLNHPVPLGAAPVLSPGTPCPEGRPSPLPLGEPQFKAVVTQAAAALSSLLDQLRLHPTPPVRVAVALIAPDTGLALPPGVLCEEGSLPQEETQAWARWAGRAWGAGPGHVCMCEIQLWSACHAISLRPPGLSTTGHMRPWPRTGPSLHLGRSYTSWTGSWMGRWGQLGVRAGLGGAEPCQRECCFVPRILRRTAPRDRVQEHPSVSSRKFSWQRGEENDL